MAKYLVTGGAGFIGCNLARYILDKGHEVVPEYWQEPRLVEFFLKHLLAP